MPPLPKSKPVAVDLVVTELGQEISTDPVRTGTSPHPRLVNRGPAGLLHKMKPLKAGLNPPAPAVPVEPGKLTEEEEIAQAPINRFGEDLRLVPISQLVPDPQNARLHPERNMKSIKLSLARYGQVKPVVVRKSNNVIVAGNGTHQAMTEMGWTQIGASFVDMDDVAAIGYGLSDNRTAELAKWDFEVVARLDQLLHEAGQDPVGWSMDELSVLRAADWTPPPTEDVNFTVSGGGAGGDPTLLVSFTPDQYEVVGKAIALIKSINDQSGFDQPQALEKICSEWFEQCGFAAPTNKAPAPKKKVS